MVKTGKLSDPRAEEHLYRTILERQRACGEVYLNRLNPLVDFRVEGGRLAFANLAEKHRLGAPGARYRARWPRLDNDSGEKLPLGMPVETGEAVLELPRAEAGAYLCAEIRTVHERHPAWGKSVEVPDQQAAEDDYLRVIDESGEDYLYPACFFVALELPKEAERALRAKPANRAGVARR